MIDEIRIKGLEDWPEQAVYEFTEHLRGEIEPEFVVDTDQIIIELPDTWPNLKRENLKRGIAKSLSKYSHDHGYEAQIESVEHVEHTEVKFE